MKWIVEFLNDEVEGEFLGCCREACGDSQDIRQEDAEDAAGGTGTGLEKDEGVVTMGKKLSQVKAELLADEEFSREYEGLEEEFSVAGQLIEARMKAHLTQEEVARRMGTTQSVVARLESGSPLPSLRSLRRYASAIGGRLEIRLVR